MNYFYNSFAYLLVIEWIGDNFFLKFMLRFFLLCNSCTKTITM